MSLCRPLLRSAVCGRRGTVPCGGLSSAALSPLRVAVRTFFVRFQETPNEACYKFYVDGKRFLPPDSLTMMFDRSNDYQSPLAHDILAALPMVEEVTIGGAFVTVKRVEEAHAAAAARYFAMKFHGASSLAEDPESAAERSEALQARVNAVLNEDEAVDASPVSSSPPAGAVASEPLDQANPADPADPASFELGGFTLEKSEQDEAIDEAALEALIAATDWSELKLHVSALITDHLISGDPHVSPDAPHPHADTLPQEGDSEVVLILKELIATTIRPQLQDDGGDIRFVGYDTVAAVMEVEMLGACRTCKSSKTTLVDLIERTTRHWVPEVMGVREVPRTASPFEAFLDADRDELEQSMAATREPVNADEDEELEDMPPVPPTGAAVTDAAGRVKVREESGTSGHRVLREVKPTRD